MQITQPSIAFGEIPERMLVQILCQGGWLDHLISCIVHTRQVSFSAHHPLEINERHPSLHVIRLFLAHAFNHVLVVFEGSIILERDLGLIRLSDELGNFFVRDTISAHYVWKMSVLEHHNLAGESSQVPLITPSALGSIAISVVHDATFGIVVISRPTSPDPK